MLSLRHGRASTRPSTGRWQKSVDARNKSGHDEQADCKVSDAAPISLEIFETPIAEGDHDRPKVSTYRAGITGILPLAAALLRAIRERAPGLCPGCGAG